MRRKQWIVWSCLAVLLVPLFVGSAAAFVFTDLVAKVQRIILMSNQVAQITALSNQLTELKGQYQHIKDATMGQIQALTQPFTSLASQGTGLVSDAMSWKSQFSGVPGDLADAVSDMGSSGTSLTTTWSSLLQQADTVSEADMVALYTDQAPAVSQSAADGWRQSRERADNRMVMNNAVADAAAELAKALKEAKEAIEDLKNQTNMSDTALAQAQLAGSLTQGNLGTAQAQLASYKAAQEVAKVAQEETYRRQKIAQWTTAQQNAQTALQSRLNAIDADRDAMRDRMLFRVHPFYKGQTP